MKYRMLIGGELVEGERSLAVLNPATEEIISSCACASQVDLDKAVESARRAYPRWQSTPVAERRAILNAMAEKVEHHAEALARLLTLEQGKPLADAQGEVAGCAAFFRYFAGLAAPEPRIESRGKRRVAVNRVPLGVIGCIVPWNYPLLLMAFKVPPAMLAGNTLVLKPAPTTPLSTLRLAELWQDVVPPGVLNVIADSGDIGPGMSAHPHIAKISFTGSTVTGRAVMAGAAGTLKRLTLELGGNDAALVLDDADPQAVAASIFSSAFQNSGQVCVAIKRLFVHERVYDATVDELAKLADATLVGDGLDPAVRMGPLQNRRQYERVLDLLAETEKQGVIAAGGARLERPGYFVRPTIVRDIVEGNRLVDEEQFGPVLPVLRFRDDEEGVARANASPFGLGASVWSPDIERCARLARRLEAGTVWINRHLDLAPNIPFGGVKQSGFGAELGAEGILECTQLQVVDVA